MSISFDGIGEVAATFRLEEDSKVKVGDVVCITGDGEVGRGTAGDRMCGVAVSVSDDGYAAVQTDGLAEIAYTGTTAPTAGWNALKTDGTGGVCVPESGGTSYLVVSVDTGKKTAVVKL